MSEMAAPTRGRLREHAAEEIRVILARKRMSAAELARRTGIKQSTMSRRMTGETAFDLDDLELIADVLGVSVTDLLPSRGAGRGIQNGGLNDSLVRLSRSADVPPAKSGSPFPRVASRPSGQPRKTVTRPGSPIPATRRPVPVQPPVLPSLRAGLPMTA